MLPCPGSYAQDLAAMDLLTTTFAQRGRGHGTALLRAAEQFLGSKARVKRLVAVASADEKEALAVMTKKFGFSRLNGRQARVLAAEFPALQVWLQGCWGEAPAWHAGIRECTTACQGFHN